MNKLRPRKFWLELKSKLEKWNWNIGEKDLSLQRYLRDYNASLGIWKVQRERDREFVILCVREFVFFFFVWTILWEKIGWGGKIVFGSKRWFLNVSFYHRLKAN